MSSGRLPDIEWGRADLIDAGLDPDALAGAQQWLEQNAADRPYRAVVVRNGLIVAEWERGVARDARLGIASASKSLFSCALGLAAHEGRVGSMDDKVVDYYPEMMDVPDGRGPKPGRFAKPEDRGITFRQLISNTSGYMKPGEAPGSTFHYQTFGMNILCHALGKVYGVDSSADPEGVPGIGAMVEEKIRNPIDGSWTYVKSNFDHPPGARTGIFGYFTRFECTARDMARIGLLWLHGGRWGDRQVVPEGWVARATRVEDVIQANCPEEQWCYGLGFWTNEHGVLWPSLPRDSFAASGAGRQHIWVCPSLDLVVAQSPGIYEDQRDSDTGLLGHIVKAAGG